MPPTRRLLQMRGERQHPKTPLLKRLRSLEIMSRLFSKPPRLSVITQSQPLYFVTFCTMYRRSLLANDAVHDAFRQYAQAGMEHGAGVGQYVLMPDHVHLFVRMSGETTLGRWIGGLKRAMGKAVNPRVLTGVSPVVPRETQDAADTAATTAEGRVAAPVVTGVSPVQLPGRDDAADTPSASSGQAAATTVIQPNNPTTNLWQPGFFDHLLRHDESYAEKWLYVRDNPVREHLVAKWDDWPYHGEIVVIDRV